MVLLAVVGVVMNVLGPKILGMATDVIFTGVIGKSLPSGAIKGAGRSRRCALRAMTSIADMVERLNVIPGLGIDFTLLGQLLLLALGLYLVASLFLWLQGYLLNGAVQRSIYTAAQPGRGEDQQAAAQLLRQADPRRAPEPGDQ